MVLNCPITNGIDAMPKYKIANLVVEIKNRYDYIPKQCADYICSEYLPTEIEITVTDEDILREQKSCLKKFPEGYLESICFLRKLAIKLPTYDAMLLHASAIAFKEKGIAFLAPSGTGKTTHTLLWHQLLGNDMHIINGDKPIVRLHKNVPYIYGTPWAGKENFQINNRVVLTDLCFIERAKINETAPLDISDVIPLFMKQILRPKNSIKKRLLTIMNFRFPLIGQLLKITHNRSQKIKNDTKSILDTTLI